MWNHDSAECGGGREPEQSKGPLWYVACTVPRHEKQVAEQLRRQHIEPYLPLYRTVRRWKNQQRVTLELPLLPGYVFVRVPIEEKVRVLSLPGVSRFVSFNGPPVAISEVEIDRLREALELLRVEPHPFLKIGQRVRIRRGPLDGQQGVLVRKKDSTHVVLSIDLLMRAVAVYVDPADLDVIN